jgi:hypothetical protein
LGVTHKFAQIFFRVDKDLRGKRSKDPKNAYVTGIFGGAYFLEKFVPHIALINGFNVEIPHDSNMLGKVSQ